MSTIVSGAVDCSALMCSSSSRRSFRDGHAPSSPIQKAVRHAPLRPANEMLPAQLGPLLHVQHAPSPGLDNTIEPGSPTPRTPPPPPEGGQISTGEEGSVSHRRRQPAPRPADERLACRLREI